MACYIFVKTTSAGVFTVNSKGQCCSCSVEKIDIYFMFPSKKI